MDVDPFASIAQLCRVSSSQEDRLRHCPFAPEPEESLSREDPWDSGETPVDSVGIVMVSPPESSMGQDGNDSSTPQDVFQTPPEGSVLASSEEQRPILYEISNRKTNGEGISDTNGGETMAVDRGGTDDANTVDLGKDSDLGFSQVELAQRANINSEMGCSRGVDGVREGEVSESESKKFGVLNGEFCSEEGLGESQLKKIKIYEKNLGYESPKAHLAIIEAETEKNLAKSTGKLKSKKVTPCNLSSKSPHNVQIRENLLVETGVDGESHGESSAKKKLDFSDEPVAPDKHNEDEIFQSEFGQNSGDSGLGEEYIRKLDTLLKKAEKILMDEIFGEAGELQCNGKRELARKNIEDIEKFRYVDPSVSNSDKLLKYAGAFRALPLSFCRPGENAGIGEEYTRKLDFLLEETDKSLRNEELCEAEELLRNGERELVRKNIEDIDKFRYIDTNVSNPDKLPKHTAVRALPLSFCRRADDAVGGESSEPPLKDQLKISLLDVLKKLGGDFRDPSLENVSAWDVAKRRGMTFPRPRSWPDPGFTAE